MDLDAVSHPHLVDLASTLLTAMLASFHCAGMCGGFAIGASAGSRLLPSQGLYHLGKTTTYLGIGAVVGLASKGLAIGGAPWHALRWLALLAAGLLVVAGLHALGAIPRRLLALAAQRSSALLLPLQGVFRAAASHRGPLRALVLGTLSGLLPCPLVYAFVAKAAASGSVLLSLANLGALGLGTVPVLVAVAASGHALSPLLRARMVRASGVFLLFLGLYTGWRGVFPLSCCSPGAHL